MQEEKAIIISRCILHRKAGKKIRIGMLRCCITKQTAQGYHVTLPFHEINGLIPTHLEIL